MFDTEGFNPFDTLAVAWLTHPTMIEQLEVQTWIELHDGQIDKDGQPSKPHLLVDPEKPGGRRAIYCYRPKPELKSIIIERLGG